MSFNAIACDQRSFDIGYAASPAEVAAHDGKLKEKSPKKTALLLGAFAALAEKGETANLQALWMAARARQGVTTDTPHAPDVNAQLLDVLWAAVEYAPASRWTMDAGHMQKVLEMLPVQELRETVISLQKMFAGMPYQALLEDAGKKIFTHMPRPLAPRPGR